jgi:hypothetical protein
MKRELGAKNTDQHSFGYTRRKSAEYRIHYRLKNPHSRAYDYHVLLQLINAAIEDVSIKAKVSNDRVFRVLERRIDGRIDWGQYESKEVLGIDEFVLRKGMAILCRLSRLV